MCFTVILFSVIVPVLSEHMTDVQPRVSTLCSRFTRAFTLSIRFTARASAIVTVAGSPSGIAAMAIVIPVISISKTGSPLKTPAAKTIRQTPIQMNATIFPSSPRRFWSGVCELSAFDIMLDIFPTCAFLPVAVTRHSAFPLVIIVPE